MNKHPLLTREALARLHPYTQRFWTWLTALKHQNEAPRAPWTANEHLVAFFGTAVLAFTLAAWSTQQLYTAWPWPLA